VAQRAAAARPLQGRPDPGIEPDRHRALHVAGRESGVVRGLLAAGELRRAAVLPVGPKVEHGPAAGIDQGWPVTTALADLLPTGMLSRGSVVPILGSTSLLWAMISAASQAGAWVAVVGMPEAGVLAAVEHGIVLERLALIAHPDELWPTVVAALLEGVDLVVAQPPGQLTAAVGRQLAARVRQRSAVLLLTRAWDGAHTTLTASEQQWYGLEQGRGRLRARQLTVTATGRGRLARPRQVRVWLPDRDGTAIAPVTVVPLATRTLRSRAA
jgi:hypothetical protein